MRGMELLTKLSSYTTMSSEQVISYYDSPDFRNSTGYQDICSRVLPPVSPKEMLPLFYSSTEMGDLEPLQKKGFVSEDGKILSSLLVDAYLASLYKPNTLIANLGAGLEGIAQVLQGTLPGLQWSQYDRFGGPIEDALSFELLSGMARIPQVTARLFNPKLVDSGTSARRPDIYINSQVNSFIQCVLTDGSTREDKKRLDERIGRFLKQDEHSDAYYKLSKGQDWAILNFQKTGTVPLEPSDKFSQSFDERVFTFIMADRKIFRGKDLLN